MTENRAISKAETTGMTLEDVIQTVIDNSCPHSSCVDCGIDDCNEDTASKIVADYIRGHKKELGL